MKKVAQISFAVLLIICLLCTVDTWIGSYQIPAYALPPFNISQCANSICVAGIKPSITTWEKARVQLAALSNSSTVNDSEYRFVQQGITFEFWRDQRTATTNVAIEGPLFRLGDLIQNFGQPCFLDITDTEVYLIYPQFFAEIYPQRQQPLTDLRPSLPLSTLDFSSIGNECVLPFFAPAAQNIQARWCGFASIDFYLQECRN